MSRKADPILVRSGLNRLWWVNLAKKTTPASYQYLIERFDKSLKSVNAMLVDLKILHIKSYNKHIVQAVIFKYFSPRFKKRVRLAGYRSLIDQIFYILLWRRWYRRDFVMKKKTKNGFVMTKMQSYFKIFFFYTIWNNFLKQYAKKSTFYKTTQIRLFLQKYFYHNAYGILIDPIETYSSTYTYEKHPEVYFLASKDKKLRQPVSSNRKDVKWAQNLTRLIDMCSKFSRLDFTYVLSKFLAIEMEKDKRHWPFIQALRKALKFIERENDLKGIKIRFVGKLKGARRSRVYDIKSKWPAIPFQSFANDIYVSSATAHTVYGSVGIKVMVWRK